MVTQRGKTRDEIVEAAAALFYQRGYAQTSFSDIVKDTGIQRGNIYHYFKTKDDILGAVIERRATEYKAGLLAWDAAIPNPRDRLRNFVRMLNANKNVLVRYGCPIGSLNTELGKEAYSQNESARQLFDLFRDWMEIQFAALGNPQKARARALHLLGRAQGISLLSHVYKDPIFINDEVKILEEWINTL